MKVENVYYNESSFGITRKSLLMLRNAIGENVKRELLVIQVPTSDITCGFFVFVKHEWFSVAIWSGDGFRTDGGGEGGRGYASAIRMLGLFGLDKYGLQYLNHDEVIEEWGLIHGTMNPETKERKILSMSQKVLDEFTSEESGDLFKSIYETYPHY